MTTFLTVEEVADRYRTSIKAIHDKTRIRTDEQGNTITPQIPHLKRVGIRRILFPLADLEAWDSGAALEAKTLPDGSRRVVPVGDAVLSADAGNLRVGTQTVRNSQESH